MTLPAAKTIKTAAESIRTYKQLIKSKKPRKEIYPYLFRALELEPDHPEANFLKGDAILHYHYTQWPEALECFDITIESGWKRRLVWALTLKGSLLLHLDRQQEAEGVLDQAVTIGTNQLMYLTAYFGDTLYVRLVQELLRAGMMETFKSSAYQSWAQHYLDDEKTQKTVERIAQKNDEFFDLQQKGNSAVKKRNLEEAVKHFENALQIANNYPVYKDGFQVYHAQFLALRELKEYNKALLIAGTMTQKFYFHKLAWRYKGLIDLHMERYASGVKSFTRALELGDESPVSWNGKAAALVELKQYPKALKCVSHTLEIDPDNDYAKQLQTALHEILQ